MSFNDNKDPKVKLPYLSLIYVILTAQSAPTIKSDLLENPTIRQIDRRLLESSHVVDIRHMNIAGAENKPPVVESIDELTAKMLKVQIDELDSVIENLKH